jgi:hypothetical protein
LIAPIQSSDSARSKACGQNRLHLTLRGEQPQGEVWWGASEEMTTTFMVDRPSASYLRRAPTDPTSADRRRRGLHLSASTIGRLALLIDPGLAAAFRIRVKGAVGSAATRGSQVAERCHVPVGVTGAVKVAGPPRRTAS